MSGRFDDNIPVFVTIRWLLVLPEAAPMFSVDENSSSLFSFLHCYHSRLIIKAFLSMIWKGNIPYERRTANFAAGF